MNSAGTEDHVLRGPDMGALDVEKIRADFPILRREANGHPLVYLDNAATTQKPRRVIEAIRHFYESENANIHRGVHLLSQVATQAFEESRRTVQDFVNAEKPSEIIWVRGATEGLNLVAQSFARERLGPRDEVLLTGMEHHSNIVPWQLVCQQTGAKLRVLPILESGELDLEKLGTVLTERTRIFGLVHVSNALGTVNPVKELTRRAHEVGATVVVDAAQSIPHLPVDVQDLGIDFLAFSGHKVFGPTGIGALYGREELLEAMPPYQGGGDMISSVTFEKTLYNELPYKFEAGTPNVAGAVGLREALRYISEIDLETTAAYESDLLAYAHRRMGELDGVRIVGMAQKKASVLSFVLRGVHPHDIGTLLDQEGVAVRTGHHCAQPVMDFYGVPATTRASLAFYNTREEIDCLVEGVKRVSDMFSQ